MKISQFFTGQGILGVILFFAGNVIGGWRYAALLDAPRFDGLSGGDYLAMLVCGLAVLASIPLMLIGREYHVDLPEDWKNRPR